VLSGPAGCVQGLPTDFNGWSALAVKWLSYAEEISPFKVGNIQKLIADVSKDAYVPPPCLGVSGWGWGQGWGQARGGAPCRAVSRAVSRARALAGRVCRRSLASAALPAPPSSGVR